MVRTSKTADENYPLLFYLCERKKSMMEIKILRLTIENFKGHAYLNLQLDGQSVSIYGDNATGKTSV